MSISTRVVRLVALCVSTSSDVRRRRFFGLFGSQAPQPSARPRNAAWMSRSPGS